MIKVKVIKTGTIKENCYIVSNFNNNCIIIDPGSNANLIINYVGRSNLIPLAILNTHGHFDHIGAVTDVKKHFGIPFYIHSKEQKLVKAANLYMKAFQSEIMIAIPKIDMYFDDVNSNLMFGKILVQVLQTPGHTKGGVSFLIDGHLFTGDTLFKGTVGRVDFPGGSQIQLNESLRKIAKLPIHLVICPGHGDYSTIESELINNQKFIEANNEHNY